jgi:N-dimethylarginine dimethylaminohydrolase
MNVAHIDTRPRFGLDNHTGRLTDVLVGRPDHFVWRAMNATSAVTMATKERLGLEFDRPKALEQWRGMLDAFSAAGARCHELPADEGLTHSVFARDSSLMTPWGPVITAIQTEARRRDYAVVSRFYAEQGIPIWRWVTAGYFEGGDFVIARPGAAVLGYSGERSTKAGADQVAGWLREEGWDVLTVPLPPQFVHIDTTIVMLADGLALVCEDAHERPTLDWLHAHGIRWIDVPYREVIRLGANVLALGEGRVLGMEGNVTINERLRSEGLEVIEIPYDQFTLGGGGVHCSTHELRRESPGPEQR